MFGSSDECSHQGLCAETVKPESARRGRYLSASRHRSPHLLSFCVRYRAERSGRRQERRYSAARTSRPHRNSDSIKCSLGFAGTTGTYIHYSPASFPASIIFMCICSTTWSGGTHKMKRFASEGPQRSRNTQLKSDQVHGFGVIQEDRSPANARPMPTKRCLACATRQDVATCCRLRTLHFQENSQFGVKRH